MFNGLKYVKNYGRSILATFVKIWSAEEKQKETKGRIPTWMI